MHLVQMNKSPSGQGFSVIKVPITKVEGNSPGHCFYRDTDIILLMLIHNNEHWSALYPPIVAGSLLTQWRHVNSLVIQRHKWFIW